MPIPQLQQWFPLLHGCISPKTARFSKVRDLYLPLWLVLLRPALSGALGAGRALFACIVGAVEHLRTRPRGLCTESPLGSNAVRVVALWDALLRPL